MFSPLTLENCLILACARTDPDAQRIKELVERGPDWPGVLLEGRAVGLVVVGLHQPAAGSPIGPRAEARCGVPQTLLPPRHDSRRRPARAAASDPPPVRGGERSRRRPEGGGAVKPGLSLSGIETDAEHRAPGPLSPSGPGRGGTPQCKGRVEVSGRITSGSGPRRA